MPCRCCNASRPSKGFQEKGEAEIYALLKQTSQLILNKNLYGFDDIDDWKFSWIEAFDHMLNGCTKDK